MVTFSHGDTTKHGEHGGQSKLLMPGARRPPEDGLVENAAAIALFRSAAHVLIQAGPVPGAVGYWRSTNNRELDFVVPARSRGRGGRVPIEVKGDSDSRVSRARLAISKAFGEGIVVSRTLFDPEGDVSGAASPIFSRRHSEARRTRRSSVPHLSRRRGDTRCRSGTASCSAWPDSPASRRLSRRVAALVAALRENDPPCRRGSPRRREKTPADPPLRHLGWDSPDGIRGQHPAEAIVAAPEGLPLLTTVLPVPAARADSPCTRCRPGSRPSVGARVDRSIPCARRSPRGRRS
jgi:hypothetical protein